jgi:hypothetical protein
MARCKMKATVKRMLIRFHRTTQMSLVQLTKKLARRHHSRNKLMILLIMSSMSCKIWAGV